LDRLLQPLAPSCHQIYTNTVKMPLINDYIMLQKVCLRIIRCTHQGHVGLGYIVTASGSVILSDLY
jgi:hypothetical protein